jgi:ribose 5-phosphate isomerase A
MDREKEKFLAAQAAVTLVSDGMTLGLGTGSTVKYALELLGKRVNSGLRIRGVATSIATADLAAQLGISIISLEESGDLDVDIDGADEVDPSLQLVKGGGGALLREKIVAFSSARMIVIGDSSKYVERLGRFPLPIEVISLARPLVERSIKRLGGVPRLRLKADHSPFLTDQGNWILDCDFGSIDQPLHLAQELSAVPGLVEHGLFIGVASEALIGRGDRVERISARCVS